MVYQKFPTDEELKTFLEEVKDPRHQLICLFAVYMGLRRSEIVRIRLKDINFNEATLTLPEQKNGDKGEKMPIPSFLLSKILDFVEQDKFRVKNDFLFSSTKSKSGHISSDSVKIMVSRIRKTAGLDNFYKIGRNNAKFHNFSFHSLRHWYGTRCYKKTKDLLSTQMMLRHKSINNTMIYVHINNIDKKKEIINQIWAS